MVERREDDHVSVAPARNAELCVMPMTTEIPTPMADSASVHRASAGNDLFQGLLPCARAGDWWRAPELGG